jgi:ABC-type Mn2+/Zn2+ transport system ATPase subunit
MEMNDVAAMHGLLAGALMILTFATSKKSIKEFPTTNLPSFTLVTGLNGSGKSHLLEAIRDGNIRTDLASNFQTEVRWFSWQEMVPQDSGGYASGQLAQEREVLRQEFTRSKKIVEENIRSLLRNNGITGVGLSDPCRW